MSSVTSIKTQNHILRKIEPQKKEPVDDTPPTKARDEGGTKDPVPVSLTSTQPTADGARTLALKGQIPLQLRAKVEGQFATTEFTPTVVPLERRDGGAEDIHLTTLQAPQKGVELLTSELEKTDPAGQDKLMKELVEKHPEDIAPLLAAMGMKGDTSPLVAEVFGRVYAQREAEDPAAAKKLLESMLISSRQFSPHGPEITGLAKQIGTSIARSGSPELQAAAAQIYLRKAREYSEAASTSWDPTMPSKSNAALAGAMAASAQTPMGRTLAMLDEKLGSAKYGFSLNDLRLDALDAEGWADLEKAVSDGTTPLEGTLGDVETLQKYWGYDNKTMSSALREMYYPSFLDPFVKDAHRVDNSIYKLGDGASSNGVDASDAALARVRILLGRQGEKYAPPIVKTEPGPELAGAFPTRGDGFSGEFGFDHVIAGLDGSFHSRTGVDPRYPIYRWGLPLAGGNNGDIKSMDAVTWLGDLAGVVEQGLVENRGVESKRPSDAHRRHGRNPELSEQYKKALGSAADAGYAREMPFEDFNGDVLAYAASKDLKASDHNLASHLRAAFDPQGAVWKERYETFAKEIGLEVNKDTGQITNKDAFVDKWTQTVSALGKGLKKDVGRILGGDRDSDYIAKRAIEKFLDQLEQKIIEEKNRR